MQTQTMHWPVGVGLACALALALVAPGAARADDGRSQALPPITSAAPEQPPIRPEFPPVFTQAVATEALGALRGGAQATHNEMTLAGTTADNSAYQVSTGSNAITSGSFANMSGIPVVIQNTGANVLIQNAVILNLQMN